MWELISSNKKKSLVLLTLLGLSLVLIGFLFGEVYLGEGGGSFGIFFALILWSILSIISYFSGSSILLSISKAQEVTPDVHRQLFNIVEEMKLASNLPKMPKIYIINEEAPNAFATGTKPENSAVAVTAGLVSRLNRDELQGVVAHEISHITNRDILLMTLAGIMLGSIVLISEIFLRGFWFSSGSSGRYRSKSSGGGQGQIILVIISIAFAILAPIFARLLYFAISRKREYLADASAVRLTRYPEGLASALEKISSSNLDMPSANKITAPMYIVNPLKKKGMKISDLTSTHPPISERIRILRSMASGAGYRDYQQAYNTVKGRNIPLIPSSGLNMQESVRIRETELSAEEEKTARSSKRTLGHLMMSLSNFTFISCGCGLKLKIPPDYRNPDISCPKCGQIHNIFTQN